MKPSPTIFYQFALSHYCEKVRWALDYKGVSYEVVNFIPGPHIFQARRLAPKTSVPILMNDGEVIQDSTKIIDHLERKYPKRPLNPAREDLKKEALELEEYFDEEVGVHLRRLMYFYVLEDRRLASSLLLQNAPGYGRSLYRVLFPILRKMMKRAMKIYPEPTRRSEQRLTEALDRLGKQVSKDPFLVGGQFSRADLAAASLLAPLCTPAEHDFDWPALETMPEPLQAFRRAHEHGPAFDWVLKVYKQFRR